MNLRLTLYNKYCANRPRDIFKSLGFLFYFILFFGKYSQGNIFFPLEKEIFFPP